MLLPCTRVSAHFAINAATGELRARGDVVKLSPQPFKVLELLVRRNGDVVTRNEIREHVWCGDTFVDFEQGLNFCIRQIREALGDTADAPRFIETLPRRGYRFLMPVESAEERPHRTITRLIVLPFRMLRPDPGHRVPRLQPPRRADGLPGRPASRWSSARAQPRHASAAGPRIRKRSRSRPTST